jgi:hypothetical protein
MERVLGRPDLSALVTSFLTLNDFKPPRKGTRLAELQSDLRKLETKMREVGPLALTTKALAYTSSPLRNLWKPLKQNVKSKLREREWRRKRAAAQREVAIARGDKVRHPRAPCAAERCADPLGRRYPKCSFINGEYRCYYCRAARNNYFMLAIEYAPGKYTWHREVPGCAPSP